MRHGHSGHKLFGLLLFIAMSGLSARGSEIVVTAFDGNGQLTFNALADGTDYVYRVEWASSPAGPWSTFDGAGSWLDRITAAQGSSVTSTVPLFYRVIAHPGDYMVIDISEGSSAESYPVTYYRTLADVPGGPNSDLYKTNSLLLRRVPAGTFIMGSPLDELGRSFTGIQHQVTLTQDFYIGVFQVTQKQWERVMGDWPSYFNNMAYRDARPVEQVSYNVIRGASAGSGWPTNSNVDATSFMGRLRARTGRAFDLPTESQWEYAARAGTTTALNSDRNLTATESCPNMNQVGRYLHNGGSDSSQGGDASVGTAKVGSYQSNNWGLYDMHGNVWEWCLDWYGTYPDTVTNPKGPSSGANRVFRGGSWHDDAWLCRSACRNAYSPSLAHYIIGFRIALSAAAAP